MRGRPPLPTAVKEANGNPGKRALNHDEPEARRRVARAAAGGEGHAGGPRLLE